VPGANALRLYGHYYERATTFTKSNVTLLRRTFSCQLVRCLDMNMCRAGCILSVGDASDSLSQCKHQKRSNSSTKREVVCRDDHSDMKVLTCASAEQQHRQSSLQTRLSQLDLRQHSPTLHTAIAKIAPDLTGAIPTASSNSSHRKKQTCLAGDSIAI